MSENNYFKSCVICSSKVKNVEVHLSDAHKVNIEVKFVKFLNVQDFLKWKENVEKETVSRYVKQYGAKRRKDGRVVTYYHCHRDGNYIPKGRNKRSLKRIGSNKINGTCPSLMKAEQDGEGVRVRFVATHVGHTCDVGRMVLTTSEKDLIAAKANMKVPFEDILSEIRNSAAGEKLQKIHLTKRQDIRNIIVKYQLENKYKVSEAETDVQEIEIQCKEASQTSSDGKELPHEEFDDLEEKKAGLIDHVTKIIQNIKSEAELIKVEEFLMPLETIINPKVNSRNSEIQETFNDRSFSQQQGLLFTNHDHDLLCKSLKKIQQSKKTKKVKDREKLSL